MSEEIETRAEEVFRRFNQDKYWSFTDGTSKVIMEMLGITEAFAFDDSVEMSCPLVLERSTIAARRGE